MFGRDYFGGPVLGGIRPTARLAGRPRLGQSTTRCKPPDGSPTLVFDTNYDGSGQCGAISSDVSDTSAPACVPDTRGLPFGGAWMPSSCAIAPVEPGGPTAPPAAQNLSVSIIACPIGGNLYNLYEDAGAPPYTLVSEGRNNAQANAEGHILPSTDPRCVAALGAAAPSASPPPSAPLPPSTPPPYYAPPPTTPPPPGQVQIQPTPFGGGSVAPRQVPFAPNARGMAPQRSTFSSCPANTPPVRVRKLRSETFQARPDNFQAPLWTSF